MMNIIEKKVLEKKGSFSIHRWESRICCRETIEVNIPFASSHSVVGCVRSRTGLRLTRRKDWCLCWCSLSGSASLLPSGPLAAMLGRLEEEEEEEPSLTWFPPRSWFMLGLGAAAAWNGFGCSANGFLAGGPPAGPAPANPPPGPDFLLSTRLSRLTRAECSPSKFSTALLGLAPVWNIRW